MAQTHNDPTVENVTVAPAVVVERVHRMSWGAVIAGIVIALVTMLALHMLGLALGAATINPEVEHNPVGPALGTGAVIWMAGSTLISLFLGGVVAGRFAGTTNDEDGVLHGLVVWGVVTLISLYAVTTSVGSIVSSFTSAAGTAIANAGSALADVSPEVADALELNDLTLQGIQGEVRSLLQQTNDPALQGQPAEPGTTGEDTANTPTNSNNAMLNSSVSLAELEMNRVIGRVLKQETIADADRQEIVTLLMERTGLTEDEARATLERWEQTYVQIRDEAEETAREASQALADAVTVLAGAVFASMVLGAFAAGAGGMVGTPPPVRLVKRQTVNM